MLHINLLFIKMRILNHVTYVSTPFSSTGKLVLNLINCFYLLSRLQPSSLYLVYSNLVTLSLSTFDQLWWILYAFSQDMHDCWACVGLNECTEVAWKCLGFRRWPRVRWTLSIRRMLHWNDGGVQLFCQSGANLSDRVDRVQCSLFM